MRAAGQLSGSSFDHVLPVCGSRTAASSALFLFALKNMGYLPTYLITINMTKGVVTAVAGRRLVRFRQNQQLRGRGKGADDGTHHVLFKSP